MQKYDEPDIVKVDDPGSDIIDIIVLTVTLNSKDKDGKKIP
ncbi:hypothetical protein DSUL_200005 [Desulfovibrionales bacterium]